MSASQRDYRLGVLFAGLSALGFASKAVFIRFAYARTSLDAVSLLTLRMLFSLPFLLIIAWRASRGATRPLRPRDWVQLAWLGFLGYYLSSFLDFWGLEYISAALERVILFTYPTWVLVFSAVFLGRAFTGRDVIALVLASAGILLSFANDLRSANSPEHLWKGAALVLGASLVYSVYLISSGSVVQRVGSARFTPWVALPATAYIVVHFAATRSIDSLRQPASVYWLSAALAVFATILPIVFLVESLRRVSAGTIAIVSSVGPIITILLGAIFLGEPITVVQLAGAILVLSGVGLISLRQGKSVSETSIPDFPREPRPRPPTL